MITPFLKQTTFHQHTTEFETSPLIKIKKDRDGATETEPARNVKETSAANPVQLSSAHSADLVCFSKPNRASSLVSPYLESDMSLNE